MGQVPAGGEHLTGTAGRWPGCKGPGPPPSGPAAHRAQRPLLSGRPHFLTSTHTAHCSGSFRSSRQAHLSVLGAAVPPPFCRSAGRLSSKAPNIADAESGVRTRAGDALCLTGRRTRPGDRRGSSVLPPARAAGRRALSPTTHARGLTAPAGGVSPPHMSPTGPAPRGPRTSGTPCARPNTA